MIWILVSFLALLSTGLSFLLIRATKRLLQFDDIWRGILPELQLYSADLTKLTTGGILEAHPEVHAFHRRNMKALRAIESIVDSVVSVQPAKEKPPALPRPEAE